MSADRPPVPVTPAALLAALAQVSEGVIVSDADGRITVANEAATRLCGVAPRDVAPRDVAPESYAALYHVLPDGGHPDTVFVRVTDTGRGIPREKQDAIFEPFVQVPSGYAQATEGTGLGLAISRDLARGMGGDLRVRSVEGEGSTFTVTLRGVTHAAPVGATATPGTRDASE